MAQVDADVGIVSCDAPITVLSADAALISTGNGESGLWLWHGEAPSPPSLPQPKSQVEHILARVVSAAGWAAWIALPVGLALALVALSVIHSAPSHGPESANSPVVTLPPVPSPRAARAIVAALPAQLTDAQFDQVQVPAAASTQISAPGSEHGVMTRNAQRKSLRTARKHHASHIHRGPPVLITGVLTPPVMASHGSGY
jgi:hypothetical protein